MLIQATNICQWKCRFTWRSGHLYTIWNRNWNRNQLVRRKFWGVRFNATKRQLGGDQEWILSKIKSLIQATNIHRIKCRFTWRLGHLCSIWNRNWNRYRSIRKRLRVFLLTLPSCKLATIESDFFSKIESLINTANIYWSICCFNH